MANAPTRLTQNPQYDLFLQAIVGDDASGTSVTVLSMLVRLGVDPWKEAADLAAMSKEAARQRLDTLVSRFADVPSLKTTGPDVVSQLLAFLPQGAVAGKTRADHPLSQLGPKVYGIPVYLIVAVAAAVALLFAQFGVSTSGL